MISPARALVLHQLDSTQHLVSSVDLKDPPGWMIISHMIFSPGIGRESNYQGVFPLSDHAHRIARKTSIYTSSVDLMGSINCTISTGSTLKKQNAHLYSRKGVFHRRGIFIARYIMQIRYIYSVDIMDRWDSMICLSFPLQLRRGLKLTKKNHQLEGRPW